MLNHFQPQLPYRSLERPCRRHPLAGSHDAPRAYTAGGRRRLRRAGRRQERGRSLISHDATFPALGLIPGECLDRGECQLAEGVADFDQWVPVAREVQLVGQKDGPTAGGGEIHMPVPVNP